MNRVALFAFAFAALLAFAPSAQAQYGANAPKGPAINGYDPVAYFTANQATKGKNSIAYQWDGAQWLFANEANRKAFRANPERYAPAYQGWCALAAAKGYAAEVDPKNGWAIHDGKLYLNYNSGTNKAWRKRAQRYVRDANKRWPALRTSINDGSAGFSRR